MTQTLDMVHTNTTSPETNKFISVCVCMCVYMQILNELFFLDLCHNNIHGPAELCYVTSHDISNLMFYSSQEKFIGKIPKGTHTQREAGHMTTA